MDLAINNVCHILTFFRFSAFWIHKTTYVVTQRVSLSAHHSACHLAKQPIFSILCICDMAKQRIFSISVTVAYSARKTGSLNEMLLRRQINVSGTEIFWQNLHVSQDTLSCPNWNLKFWQMTKNGLMYPKSWKPEKGQNMTYVVLPNHGRARYI